MTYQGILKDADGEPIPETTVDIRFRIYDVPTGGIDLLSRDVQVTTDAGGYFTAELDNIYLPFDEEYWLELRINGEYLSPRQKLNMSAYSARADTADYAFDAPGANSLWHIEEDVLTTDDLWGITRGNTDNVNWGEYTWSIINLGVACTTGVEGENFWYSTISGGWQNVAYPNCTVAGGVGNKAYQYASTIGGGYDNVANGWYSTIGGGQENYAEDQYATIAGGFQNTADFYSFVGGGGSNSAESYGVVCGGSGNTANGNRCSILGGSGNSNSGDYSAILGGRDNQITSNSNYVLVFGEGVYADSPLDKCYLFNGTNSGRLAINYDSNDGPYVSPIQVGTNTSNGNGAFLSGGGSWTNGSSRSFKDNIQPLDGKELLAKISSLDIPEWDYEDTDEHHIGPMAEDFVKVFDVGTVRDDGTRENMYLAAGDVAGVALAGVQVLLEEIESLKQRIAELEAERKQ